MLDFLIPRAWAADAAATASSGAVAPPESALDGIIPMLPLFAIILIFYFLMLRPQQKKAQEHQDMLKALRRGDRVVTGGGIIGTVVKLDGEELVVVEIAENVRVRVQRATIAGVMAKTEPVANSNDPDKSNSA